MWSPQVIAERKKATEENAKNLEERVYLIRFNFAVAVVVLLLLVLGMQSLA